MSNNKYIIKNLVPWMMDELLAFSQIAKFEIIFLRKQDDFFKEEIEFLTSKGIMIHTKPTALNNCVKKLFSVIRFIFGNLTKFKFDYNGIIGIKSILWFLQLDMSKFSPNSKIHAQFATQASLVSLLIKKYYDNKPKYFFTFHAHDIYFKNKWFDLLVENCNKAFSISEYNKEYIKSNYRDSDKIVLSRLGVFRDDLPPEDKLYNGKLKTFTVGLMSWFVEKKGIKYLLDAFLELKKQNYTEIKLILAGDGLLKNEFIDFINSNDLSESISFIGKVKGRHKEVFFASLDAFILPAITLQNDQDGIPVVLMEAIAYGLPLISTDISGIPEICINNYNGLLIKEKNTQEITRSIIYLSNNEEKRKLYSLNSRQLSKQFDIQENSKNKLIGLNWI